MKYNPPEPKPARAGLYEVTPPISTLPGGSQFFAVWDGMQWRASNPDWRRATSEPAVARIQGKHWRKGVSREQL